MTREAVPAAGGAAAGTQLKIAENLSDLTQVRSSVRKLGGEKKKKCVQLKEGGSML